MDADELYRHLRKEHLYCHLCDADGRNLYYASHPALAHHFRTDHYLCEEGECAGQHLTAVFRSEIDLKGMLQYLQQKSKSKRLLLFIKVHSNYCGFILKLPL